MKSVDVEVTEEEMLYYDIRAQLYTIANEIVYMEFPRDMAQHQAVSKARQCAAIHLNKMGYSHRQIMKALGLKSPQSVSKYLEAES